MKLINALDSKINNFELYLIVNQKLSSDFMEIYATKMNLKSQ